jgi:hypothetical protein
VSGLEALPVITSAGVWNVESLIVQRGRARYAMVYWFQTRQGVIGSELRTRLSLVGDALARRPTDAGIVRLMTPMTDGRSEQALLAVFASQLIPKISGALQ